MRAQLFMLLLPSAVSPRSPSAVFLPEWMQPVVLEVGVTSSYCSAQACSAGTFKSICPGAKVTVVFNLLRESHPRREWGIAYKAMLQVGFSHLTV